ncbi:lytic transglycosylase domain-containing protein [Sulfurovum sp. zt1-1]|uniref:Lytic transglycosylase domain-containing protein n=1 Tax=Sulfurovum zhangzhouensis TaxID=3019067 RepID=A0ABT7QY86_9BACT|nr:lytic transglycosylase domain-containing protein [Sulfurovum zhangzhouensis]MDM5271790.1 lytic transglycosylase domain-containing protein [Sulfurovum zhangzhouensis]
MRLKSVVLSILVAYSTSLYAAKTFSFNEIHEMPQSVEKDYYIWRFLSQKSTTVSEAKKIIQEVDYLNKKISTAYRTKTGTAPEIRQIRRTATAAEKERWKTNYQKLQELKNSKADYPAWAKENPEIECYLFNNCGSKIRKKKYDKLLNSKQFRVLSMDKTFNQSIRIILGENLPQLQRSLLQAPAHSNEISAKTHFQLGLFALKQGKQDIAMIYFGQARKKAEKRRDKDQANFWMYLVTKERGYLTNLVNSYDVNIYTLIARDLLKLRYPKIITPKISRSKVFHYDVLDPIDWAKLKQKMFSGDYNLNDLADTYKSEETVGHYTYIKAKASNFKEIYFPMPYHDAMRGMSKERQALIYAIARQESRFVPASVSRSFALGMMQIMPFLIEDIAKKKNDNIDLDDLFNPYKAIEYADFHLDYLNKWLYHPLFVAYAYNGGIGFTKKLITDRANFRPGRYEPYLSMENMTNEEAREYGKRVLTNYVIYLNQLGVPTRLLPLIKKVTDPNETDRFR